MTDSLKVTMVPDTLSAYTNQVYLSDESQLKNWKYIKLSKKNKQFVFKIEIFKGVAEKKIGRKEIGLNGMHRQACGISNGESLLAVKTKKEVASFEEWNAEKDGQTLYKVEFQLSLLKKQSCTNAVSEVELAQFIKERFSAHVLKENNSLAVEFQGTKFKLIVKRCYFFVQKSNDDDEQKSSRIWRDAEQGDFGLLEDTTDILIVLSTRDSHLSNLTWVPKPKRNKLLDPSWKFADMGIGGLDSEFSNIFRRAFASRLYPPQLINQLGIKHVKGMLLHGPPGTGKTLIARQIGKMLSCKEPKVVNGPEILNKFVGASEEKIRALFVEAEAEYAEKGDNSELHIIIFDEIDAICKQRGSTGGGTGVHDTVVNQLLTKIDGPNILNNILVIGMTNRKDMLDSALLRPGRLEVHIEIGLPDEEGRGQILKIHTAHMKKQNVLGTDVNMEEIAQRTKNYSGAEIEGLVKNALSYALYGGIDVTKGDTVSMEATLEIDDIEVSMDHFERAMAEVPAAFGVSEIELKRYAQGDLIEWGREFKQIMKTIRTVRTQVENSNRTPLMSILMHGKDGSGKTAIACNAALESEFPYVKLITPETMIGWNDRAKIDHINKVFEDSYKSPLSLIVLDCLEGLLDYVPIGPRFSNPVLQTLRVLCKKLPKYDGHKLLIIATTSTFSILEQMHFRQAFNIVLEIPQLTQAKHFKAVVQHQLPKIGSEVLGKITDFCHLEATQEPISIKPLLLAIEMATQSNDITPEAFEECMQNSGLAIKSSSSTMEFRYPTTSTTTTTNPTS